MHTRILRLKRPAEPRNLSPFPDGQKETRWAEKRERTARYRPSDCVPKSSIMTQSSESTVQRSTQRTFYRSQTNGKTPSCSLKKRNTERLNISESGAITAITPETRISTAYSLFAAELKQIFRRTSLQKRLTPQANRKKSPQKKRKGNFTNPVRILKRRATRTEIR